MMKHKIGIAGASVVLALIVMIAITVIIAVVLYVNAPSCCGPPISPTGSFTKIEKIDNHTEKLTLSDFTLDTKWTDLRFYCNDSRNGWVYDITMRTGGVLNFTLTRGYTNSTICLSGKDIAGNDKVSNNDYIVIRAIETGFISGKTYTVDVIHIQTGSVICEKTFTR
jgi:FlaG/FlaF family flagellin (archaellin)